MLKTPSLLSGLARILQRNHCYGDGWCCDLLCERCDGLDQTGEGLRKISVTVSERHDP